MTIDEVIKMFEDNAKWYEGCKSFDDSKHFKQLVEWLKELKAYREIITNAPQIITEKYGSDIIEGYADIYDMLREVQNESKSNRD